MDIKKGKIKPDYDGDLVLVDINKKWIIDSKEFVSKGKNTAFNGMEVYGEVYMTLKGGVVKYRRK